MILLTAILMFIAYNLGVLGHFLYNKLNSPVESFLIGLFSGILLCIMTLVINRGYNK